MKESNRGLNNIFRSDERLRSFLETVYKSSKEFNKTAGSLFDKVSTIVKYGDQLPGQERMDLFSNEFARSHGVNSILDIFYIDGHPAREVLPQIDDMIRRIEASEQALAILAADQQKAVSGKAVSKKRAAISNEEKLAFRDMVAKAYLQACIISGKNQVTIANYQKNAKGEDELVVTDINMIVRGDHDKPLEREDIATNKNSKKRQSSARMSRKARFKMIRDNIACCSSQKSIAYMKQHVEEN